MGQSLHKKYPLHIAFCEWNMFIIEFFFFFVNVLNIHNGGITAPSLGQPKARISSVFDGVVQRQHLWTVACACIFAVYYTQTDIGD